MNRGSEQCKVMARYGFVRFPGEALVFPATILTSPQDHRCTVSAEIVLWCGRVFLQFALFLAWLLGLPGNIMNSPILSSKSLFMSTS